MKYIDHYSSPFGELILLSDGTSLTDLFFWQDKYYDKHMTGAMEEKELTVFEQTKKWLDIYFNGSEPDFVPLIKLNGTPFQLEVWELLQKIPYGQVVTYGELAKEIAKQRGLSKMSAQAIGGAVGKNPIGVIIPCHRVIGANGSLTGYAGGIEIKAGLLKLEGRNEFYQDSKNTSIM